MKRFFTNKLHILAASIALAAILVYLPSLQNGFVNWDDEVYILDNPYIRSMGPGFFKWAFTSFYAGFWIPLTWASFALDQVFWGLNPTGYHLTNVILHGINTFLVVLLTARLVNISQQNRIAPCNDNPPQTGGWDASIVTAAVTGLLFGLHPLHVESVAWATERKDVLYALFFLLSILVYIRFVATIPSTAAGSAPMSTVPVKKSIYFFSLCFFLFALLSKPMAVSLPFVLLVLDWCPLRRFEGAGNKRAVIIEKIPFVILSLLFSGIAIAAHRFEDALISLNSTPLITRILVAFKSLLSYLGLMLWPVDLNPFYPYPVEVSPLYFEYLFAVVVVVGITAACIAVARTQRVWLAVWACYALTLLPVLGLFQAGQQAMADRFTYLPSVGPFLLLGLGVAWLFERLGRLQKNVVFALSAFIVIAMSYATIQQIGVWKDGVTLWNCVIERAPRKIPFAYRNRGVSYGRIGQYDKAMEDFNLAIAVSPNYAKVYNDRGVTYDITGQYGRAIEDFSQAIRLDPGDGLAFSNRGLIYFKLGFYEEALKDYTEAIRLTPDSSGLYFKRAEVYRMLGRLIEAQMDILEAERIKH